MAHPRYAGAGARFTFSRTLLGSSVLGLTLLLCIPILNRSAGSRVAAATAARGASTSAPASAAADPVTGSSSSGWLDAIAITPSKISTSVPKAPKTVAAGVFGPAGAIDALGIPTMVLQAYHLAADKLVVEQPACHLPWWLLAGIGHTESGHAESGRLYADGTTRGLILGPRLDGGIAGDAVITDTDQGKYDGDPVYDRAVGPMQFIPSTWAAWGVDGNGDGKKDPSNIYDATLAAGHYLCADGGNLATPAGLDAAVLSYNHSQPYLATVLAWGLAYRDGALALADSPLPVIPDVTKVRPPISSRPPAKAPPARHSSGSASSPSSAGSATSRPTGSASGSPSPSCTTGPGTTGPPTTVPPTTAPPSGTPASSSGSASGSDRASPDATGSSTTGSGTAAGSATPTATRSSCAP